jgi:hypothetical protein
MGLSDLEGANIRYGDSHPANSTRYQAAEVNFICLLFLSFFEEAGETFFCTIRNSMCS